MDTDRINHDIEIAAPVERVWDALTDPLELARWFGTDGTMTRDDSTRLELNWRNHGRYLARVEEERPPHRFAWRWALAPDVEPAPGNSTLVEFRIKEEPVGARVSVTESGFVGLDMTDGQKGTVVNDNLAGWVGGFLGLKQYLEGYRESALPTDEPEQPD
ncbi:MAG TPA: SRPBCC domain-containing protein [Candidatus Stackebrandtia excrementipullorum]|nr:SRPBCC domain-containing protein [Candidatus Stackebrandtia excrementipullorum]